jgi:hypothetical protein
MNAEQRTSLAVVRSALGRARVAQVVLGVIVAGLGWLFTLSLDETSTLGAKILVFCMTGFFALIAGVLFWVALYKSSPSRSPLIVALVERPDDVVWLYRQDTAVKVDGIDAPVVDTNIIARLADGSTVAITVKKTGASALMDALQVLAPAAATGHSDEREAQFKRDPRSLSGAGPV